jgi:hypothetical protein
MSARRRSKTPAAPIEVRSESVVECTVTLRDVVPPVWRRLLVPATTRLDQLHFILQTAMGWECRHLYRFLVDGVEYAGDEREFKDVRDVRPAESIRLYEAVPAVGTALVYEYDFGDGWTHDLVVDRVHLSDDQFSLLPACLEGARAAPPEDCGGPHGYEELLQDLRDPASTNHDAIARWVPGFEPEAFQFRAVNADFCRMITGGVLGAWPPALADSESTVDTERVDEMVLALLYLTLHERGPFGARAWKGYDWAALGRLHAKGLIAEPVGRAKSVALTREGVTACERLAARYFVRPSS